MTKFKVFNPKAKEEREVYLKLDEEDGLVTLIACDQNGWPLPSGSIASITTDGRLLLYGGVAVPGIKRVGVGAYIETIKE